MQTLVEKPRKTFRDFARLPQGTLAQLIGGEIVMSPAPRSFHQEIILNIAHIIRNYLSANKIGKVYVSPIDVKLSDEEAYQPDIVYISRERLNIVTDLRIEGVPDLVVEVLSVSTAYYDLTHKKNVYEDFGVREYIIVDPIEFTVELFENHAGKGLVSKGLLRKNGSISPALLPGLEISLSEIFNSEI